MFYIYTAFLSVNFTSYEEANLFESTTLTQNFGNDPKAVIFGDFNNALSFAHGLDIRVPGEYKYTRYLFGILRGRSDYVLLPSFNLFCYSITWFLYILC